MNRGTRKRVLVCTLSALALLVVALTGVGLLLPPVGADRYCHSLDEALRSPQSVDKLALTVQGLTKVPDKVRDLPNLSWLELSGNKIHNLPDWLTHNGKIVRISLMGNAISVFPNELTEMVNLVDLNLAYNSIGELPADICSLWKLRFLNLNGNRLDAVPLSTLHPPCYHGWRMTRGRDGALALSRTALSSATPCRF
jgi:Leucine-rich repeat (LRR) protein